MPSLFTFSPTEREATDGGAWPGVSRSLQTRPAWGVEISADTPWQREGSVEQTELCCAAQRLTLSFYILRQIRASISLPSHTETPQCSEGTCVSGLVNTGI